MWIRSQGKELLIDVDRFFVNKGSDGRSYIYVNGNPVASYSKHERAMKVMNMIKRQIASCSERYEIVRPVLRSDPFEPYWKKREVVFQMPKDSDDESEHLENDKVPEFLNKKMNL